MAIPPFFHFLRAADLSVFYTKKRAIKARQTNDPQTAEPSTSNSVFGVRILSWYNNNIIEDFFQYCCFFLPEMKKGFPENPGSLILH